MFLEYLPCQSGLIGQPWTRRSASDASISLRRRVCTLLLRCITSKLSWADSFISQISIIPSTLNFAFKISSQCLEGEGSQTKERVCVRGRHESAKMNEAGLLDSPAPLNSPQGRSTTNGCKGCRTGRGTPRIRKHQMLLASIDEPVANPIFKAV